MIIRSLRPFLSFTISPGILLSATIFFLAYLAVSIIVNNKYGDLRSATAELDRVLAQKQREVEQKRGSLRDYGQRIANLEKQINHIEMHRERQGRTNEEQESPPEMTKDLNEDFTVYPACKEALRC